MPPAVRDRAHIFRTNSFPRLPTLLSLLRSSRFTAPTNLMRPEGDHPDIAQGSEAGPSAWAGSTNPGRGNLFPLPLWQTGTGGTDGSPRTPFLDTDRSVLTPTAPSQAESIAMNYWLMKSEPNECSFDDVLASKGRTTPWTGVRNYQARNFMRDTMCIGDGVLFYHSSCPQPGIAGFAEVASAARPDPTQFDPKSKYYDPKAKPEAPRWFLVDVRATRKMELIGIEMLRAAKPLANMVTLRPGNRLSITPVTGAEWKHITGKLTR